MIIRVINGAPDRIRTCDPCLRRAVLYPAELRALILAAAVPDDATAVSPDPVCHPRRAAAGTLNDGINSLLRQVRACGGQLILMPVSAGVHRITLSMRQVHD